MTSLRVTVYPTRDKESNENSYSEDINHIIEDNRIGLVKKTLSIRNNRLANKDSMEHIEQSDKYTIRSITIKSRKNYPMKGTIKNSIYSQSVIKDKNISRNSLLVFNNSNKPLVCFRIIE